MSGTVKNQTRIGRSRHVSIWLLSAAVMIMSGPNADGANQGRFGVSGECGVHGRVFALDRTGDINGVVSGARIVFRNQGGSIVATMTADQRGYYKAHLMPGVYYYQVTAPGFKDENADRAFHCQLMHGYAVLDFSLTPGQSDEATEPSEIIPVKLGLLEGIVLERKQDGRLVAVPGAEINFQGAEGSQQTARVLTAASGTDGPAPGQYRITLPTDLWQASVTAPGFETWIDPTPIPIVADRKHTRDFVLSRSSSQPLAGDQGIKGVISIRAAEQPAPSPSQVKLAIHAIGTATDIISPQNPDVQGNYKQNTPVGRYQVVAELEGFQTARSRPRNVLSERFTVVDLVLVPSVESEVSPGKLQLLVEVYERTQDDVSGERPLEDASVLARIQGEPLSSATVGKSDEQGGVRLDVADEGTFEVLAKKEGYNVATTKVLVRHDAKNVAKLVLEKHSESMPGSELPERGLVVTAVVSERMDDDDDSVRHLPGAEVFVFRGEQPPHRERPQAVTNWRGEAEIEVPDPGEYLAAAHLPGYESAEARLVVSSQGANRVEILLRRMARDETEGPGAEFAEIEPMPGEPPLDFSELAKVPLRIQVTGPRGDKLPGAEVAIHWGPEGQDRVVAGPMNPTSGESPRSRCLVKATGFWPGCVAGKAAKESLLTGTRATPSGL
jgi:hypothetical protein